MQSERQLIREEAGQNLTFTGGAFHSLVVTAFDGSDEVSSVGLALINKCSKGPLECTSLERLLILVSPHTDYLKSFTSVKITGSVTRT